MKTNVRIVKEIEVEYLQVSADPRYWEDSEVNGIEDTEGNLIPFRNGDSWEPLIHLETGVVVGWPKGTTARIHYKVCDQGVYSLLNFLKEVVVKTEEGGYVPDILCPSTNGYGDYIIMNIDENGLIEKWKPRIDNLFKEV